MPKNPALETLKAKQDKTDGVDTPQDEPQAQQPTNGDSPDNDPAEVVSIEFNGHTFTVPKNRDEWSVQSELFYMQARVTDSGHHWVQWAEEGLGPEQWVELLTNVLRNRGDLGTFMQQFVETVLTQCDS